MEWQVPEVVEFIGANFTDEQQTEIIRQLQDLQPPAAWVPVWGDQ